MADEGGALIPPDVAKGLLNMFDNGFAGWTCDSAWDLKTGQLIKRKTTIVYIKDGGSLTITKNTLGGSNGAGYSVSGR